MKFKKNCAM